MHIFGDGSVMIPQILMSAVRCPIPVLTAAVKTHWAASGVCAELDTSYRRTAASVIQIILLRMLPYVYVSFGIHSVFRDFVFTGQLF